MDPRDRSAAPSPADNPILGLWRRNVRSHPKRISEDDRIVFPTGGRGNPAALPRYACAGYRQFPPSWKISVHRDAPPRFDLRDPPLDEAAEKAAAYAP